ncbi:MAG: hypothetical protein JXR94_03780 [Candidatus Hydrogenedentes bacterium]|nr:hypothetical protein [Candidatus Hydrogenedentota bacterium]
MDRFPRGRWARWTAWVGALLAGILLAGGCLTARSARLARVSVEEDALIVSFPGPAKAEAALALEGGEVAGLARISAHGADMLAPLPDGPRPPVMSTIVGGHLAPVTDLDAYLAERAAEGDHYTFPKRGALETAGIPVRGRLTGWRREGESVVVEVALARGRAEWVLSPAAAATSGGAYAGVQWQLRLYEAGRVYEVVIDEPVAFAEGDWRLQQRGNQSGGRAEEEFRLSHAPAMPHAISKRNYNARQQPFFFLAGRRGATLSYFDGVSRADVGEAQEGARVVVRSAIPVRPDADGCIATPAKSWVLRPADLGNKWDALNEWTWAWDRVVGDLQTRMNVAPATPRPTLFHQQFDTPGLEFGMTAEKRKAMAPPTPEDAWLRRFADAVVPKAAAWGFGLIELRAVLEADIDHAPADFPEGSFAGDSVCSPWGLRISPKLGGEPALAYLCDTAHRHGIRVAIWSAPAHQSVCSPVVRAHPEWLMINDEGRVNNRGYVTLVGMDLGAGYRRYLEGAYRQLRAATGLDGVWADSYCAFGADRDMSDAAPYPQLDEAIALQRALQDMGYTELLKEGCGPFGLSTRSSGLHDAFGREYLRYYFLYTHSDAGHRCDPGSYFRSLASKGVMEIRVVQEFEALAPDARERMVRANFAYAEALPLMKRRFLLGEGAVWQGVAWADEEGRKRVLFSFEPFDWPVPAGAQVRELMTGRAFVAADGVVHAEPWRVYVVE